MAQVALDFEKITKSGLMPLTKKFARWKVEVADIEATNKPKRESGMQIKSAMLKISTGQKLEIKVKNTGTIFQIKLNGKVLPIKHVDNMDKAVIEIVDYIQENEKSYLKSQERRVAKLAAGEKKPSVRTTRAEQIDNYTAKVAELQAENENLVKQAADATSESEMIKNKLSELVAELDELVKRGAELENELEALEKEVA
jgi:chromosome segregation ATPase